MIDYDSGSFELKRGYERDMIEDIVNGIWEHVNKRWFKISLGEEDIKCRWRIIIRKAIAGSQKLQVPKSSQEMLEETAVMERRY